MKKKIFLVLCVILAVSFGYGQDRGSLFIIGGGERSGELMKDLIRTADLSPKDYIVVLLMSTTLPDQSYNAIRKQLSELCRNAITGFNFTREQADNDIQKLDSVRRARLIYVVGGNQNRFMDVVYGTRLYTAMHRAFGDGATIAGTSAGAAIMSEIMITGEEKDKDDKNAFREIRKDNVVTAAGMGFVRDAIIDQHFIRRSRYNRLLSALADHPSTTVIGIDEATAIIVKGKHVRVAGESQVVVVSNPGRLETFNGEKVAFVNAQLSLYKPGDQFELK